MLETYHKRKAAEKQSAADFLPAPPKKNILLLDSEPLKAETSR